MQGWCLTPGFLESRWGVKDIVPGDELRNHLMKQQRQNQKNAKRSLARCAGIDPWHAHADVRGGSRHSVLLYSVNTSEVCVYIGATRALTLRE
jgi:hypothetical protein